MLLIDFPGFADKKKQSIILPFKKLAELKEQWKKLKKDKPLPLSRVAVCHYELDEADQVRCTQIFGAAAAEKVQAELTELLGLFKLKVALALDLQPDGDEDEVENVETLHATSLLKTLSAQAQALKAKVQAFKALAPAEKAQAREALNQDSLAFVQAAEAQPNLPAPLQAFLGQIKGLLPQLGAKAAGEAKAKSLDDKASLAPVSAAFEALSPKQRLEQAQTWLDKLKTQDPSQLPPAQAAKIEAQVKDLESLWLPARQALASAQKLRQLMQAYRALPPKAAKTYKA